MSIDAELLAAIHASPFDDVPRLIYADHLAETGKPANFARAEFIRVQLALARLSADHSRTESLVARQAELLQQFHSVWTMDVKGLVAGVEFRRGLLDAVSIDAEQFLARGEELFRRVPIRKVRLLNGTRVLERIASSSILDSLKELDLASTELGNGGLNILLRSPHMRSIEALDLGFNGLDDRGAALLAETTSLPALKILSLSDNRIGGEGVRRLTESAWFPRLLWLDITANAVTNDGVRALAARSPIELSTLRLTSNPIGDDGVASLLGSSLIVHLLHREPRLDFRRMELTSQTCSIIAGSQKLAEITHLDLSGNEIDSSGMKSLAGATLPKLRRLSLRGNRIDDEGGIALARSPLMKSLTHLDLANNKLTQLAADELLAARRLPQTVVELSGNFLGPEEAGSIL